MDLIDVRGIDVARERADVVLSASRRPLAGGTWLFSQPQPGIAELVDLAGLGWDPFERTDAGLTVAATCTLAELATGALDWPAAWASPAAAVPAAVDALLGSWKIHRVATVGGNVCLALPAGPMTSLAVALDGVAVVWTGSGGERRLPVSDLVTGVRSTSLADDEVLRAIELPASALEGRLALRRASLAPLGRSGVFVLVRRDRDGAFVLTVTASTRRPHALRFEAPPSPAELDASIEAIDDWYDDPHGAPDWRRAMTRRFAAELLAELS